MADILRSTTAPSRLWRDNVAERSPQRRQFADACVWCGRSYATHVCRVGQRTRHVRYNRLISQLARGTIVAEAGLTLAELIRVHCPRLVLERHAGTKFVTLGALSPMMSMQEPPCHGRLAAMYATHSASHHRRHGSRLTRSGLSCLLRPWGAGAHRVILRSNCNYGRAVRRCRTMQHSLRGSRIFDCRMARSRVRIHCRLDRLCGDRQKERRGYYVTGTHAAAGT